MTTVKSMNPARRFEFDSNSPSGTRRATTPQSSSDREDS